MSHSYYNRILGLSMALVFLLLVVQAGIGFVMLRGQTIQHSSALSEKILSDLSAQTDAYFRGLDEVLDSMYQHPEFLAGLDSDARDRTEQPARGLLSQTAYFRPLRCIWIYNKAHFARSCYNRSGMGMYRKGVLDIYADGDDPSGQCVRAFIDASADRFRAFCCPDGAGGTFLRVVKRVYQDMGRREVGYIVCDLDALALEGMAVSTLTSSNQYAWLYTENGCVCDLSDTQNARARSFMDRYDLLARPFSDMVEGNYLCCADTGVAGMTACLFTDEIEMRRSMVRLLTLLLRELAALLILYAVVALALSRRVSRRIRGVTDVLRRIEGGEIHLRLPSRGRDEIDAICAGFNSMMDHMEITTAEEARLRRAFEEARYQSLQEQVNPHFLFNTMENIGAIALAQGCDVVDEMCGALSAMLRYSIERDRADRTVSLGEELEYVRQYMFIINVRMNHAVAVDLDVPEALLSVRLPRLSVQPLVDNAVRHGLRGLRGEKRLGVHARCVEAGVEIVVENNSTEGDVDEMNRIIHSETTKTTEHTSIGIRNIQERVRLLFGEPYGLRAERDGGVTRLILLVPGGEGGDAACAERHC